jgi:acid phosphatase
MKKLILLTLATALFSCKKDEPAAPQVSSQSPVVVSPGLPLPDHIIVVWLENKSYTQITSAASAPYINSLIAEGTFFTDFHALGHPSYPEYIRFFCGTSNGKNNDDCIKGTPYSNENLYTLLKAKGKTFAWYSEDLPATGTDTCGAGKYVERHNPTQCFSNVPKSVNKKWSDFPKNYAVLENVVCISPNLDHDMHDGSISEGDAWVKDHLKDLATWCKTHNSVFVIYFDEDDGSNDNHIPVVMTGQPVKVNYKSNTRYDHYNMTRTILALYNASQVANTASRETIKDCWKE